MSGDVQRLVVYESEGAVGELYHRVTGVGVLHHGPAGELLDLAVELDKEVVLFQGAVGRGLGGADERLYSFFQRCPRRLPGPALRAGAAPAVAHAGMGDKGGSAALGEAHTLAGRGRVGKPGDQQERARRQCTQKEQGTQIGMRFDQGEALLSAG